jgi:uncharacterized membrane protein YhaH (DUF805 family)
MNHLSVWSLIVLLACLVSIVRLLTFRRGHSRHRSGYAWLSWIYVVLATASAVKIACGVRPPPGPVEAIACAAVAIVMLIHHGNLAHLHRWLGEVIAAMLRGRSL